MTETAIQKEIMDYLRARGCLVYRMNAGIIKLGRRTIHLAPAGTPDLLVLNRYGNTTWIEVKTPDGKLSRDQRAMQAELESRNQDVITVRSVEEVMEIWD